MLSWKKEKKKENFGQLVEGGKAGYQNDITLLPDSNVASGDSGKQGKMHLIEHEFYRSIDFFLKHRLQLGR